MTNKAIMALRKDQKNIQQKIDNIKEKYMAKNLDGVADVERERSRLKTAEEERERAKARYLQQRSMGKSGSISRSESLEASRPSKAASAAITGQ